MVRRCAQARLTDAMPEHAVLFWFCSAARARARAHCCAPGLFLRAHVLTVGCCCCVGCAWAGVERGPDLGRLDRRAPSLRPCSPQRDGSRLVPSTRAADDDVKTDEKQECSLHADERRSATRKPTNQPAPPVSSSGPRPVRLFAYGSPKIRNRVRNLVKDWDNAWDWFVA